MMGQAFSDDVAHQAEQASAGDEFVIVAKPTAPASPAAIAAMHIEISARLARDAGLERIFSELVELAIEACPAPQRDAMAARFNIIVGDVA